MPILLGRIAATVLLCLCGAVHAQGAVERIRLAPPQAMFRDSITLNQFVGGTLRFVLLHEIGHGFVDLYGIPVLGRGVVAGFGEIERTESRTDRVVG